MNHVFQLYKSTNLFLKKKERNIYIFIKIKIANIKIMFLLNLHLKKYHL